MLFHVKDPTERRLINDSSSSCCAYFERSHVGDTAMCLHSFQLIQAPVELVDRVHGHANVDIVSRHSIALLLILLGLLLR